MMREYVSRTPAVEVRTAADWGPEHVLVVATKTATARATRVGGP